MSPSAASTRSLAMELGLFRDREHPTYQAVPGDYQVERARSALEELSREVNGTAPRGGLNGLVGGQADETVDADGPTEGGPYRVHLHPVRNLVASPLLVGFSLLALGEDGDGGDGEPVRYAVVVNQPVELQVASVLDFLSELLERRGYGLGSGASSLAHTVAADDAVNARTVDRMRYGWRETARTLRRRAVDAGLRLELRLSRAFASSAAELTHRLPYLARVYDEVPAFRGAVDRMAAGCLRLKTFHRPLTSLARRCGCRPEALSHHVLTQAVRDALVLGNGYLGMVGPAPSPLRNLSPDGVEPLADGGAEVRTDTGTTVLGADQILHLSGFDQVGAAPGLALAELFLPAWMRAKAARISTSPADAGEGGVRGAEAVLERRVQSFLGWWSRHLPPAPLDLYFAGHPRLAA